MGSHSAKKTLKKNQAKLKTHGYIVLGASAVTILHFAYAFFTESLSFSSWLFLIAPIAIQRFCYGMVRSFGAPVYEDGHEGDTSKLVFVNDIDDGQFNEYAFDVMYIVAFCQVFSIISMKVWFLSLVVPIYGGYKLWTGVLQPFVFSRGQADEDRPETEKEKKKREKMERKMKRQQNGQQVRYR